MGLANPESGMRGLGSLLFCVLGKLVPDNPGPPQPPHLPKYLRCYRCLFETKELGCLLGSDICLTPVGSSCFTLHIKNSKLPFPTMGPALLSSLSQPPKQYPKSCSYSRRTLFHLFPSESLPISTSTSFPPQPTADWLLPSLAPRFEGDPGDLQRYRPFLKLPAPQLSA